MNSIRVIPRVLLKGKSHGEKLEDEANIKPVAENTGIKKNEDKDIEIEDKNKNIDDNNDERSENEEAEGMEVRELDADGKETLMPQTTLDHVFAACVHRLRLHKGKKITDEDEKDTEAEAVEIKEEKLKHEKSELSKELDTKRNGKFKRKNEGKKKESQAAKIARWQRPFEDAYNELMLASHEMHQLVNVAVLLQRKEKFKYTDYTRRDNSQKNKILVQLAKISRQKEYLLRCVKVLREGSRSLKRSIREQRMYISRIDSLQKRWRLVAVAHSTQQALPLRATEPISIDCTYASAGSVYMQYSTSNSSNVNEQVRVQARLSAEARKPVIVGDNFKHRQTLHVSVEKIFYNGHQHQLEAGTGNIVEKDTKDAIGRGKDLSDTVRNSVKVITEMSLENLTVTADHRGRIEPANADSDSDDEKQRYVDDIYDTGDEGDEDDDNDMDVDDDGDDNNNADVEKDTFREVPSPSSLRVSEKKVKQLLCSLQHSEFCTELFQCISREATELGDFTSGIGPDNTDSRFCGIRVAYLLSDEVGITVNEEYTIKFKIQNSSRNTEKGSSINKASEKNKDEITGKNGSMDKAGTNHDADDRDMDDFLKVLVIVLQQGLRNLHNRVPLFTGGNVSSEENTISHQRGERGPPFTEKISYIVEPVVSRFRHFLACRALRKTLDAVIKNACADRNTKGIICTWQHYERGTLSICEVNIGECGTIIRIHVHDGEFILGSVGQPRLAMHTHQTGGDQCKSCKVRKKWQHFVSKNGYQIFAPPNSIEKITKFVSSFVVNKG